MRRSRAQLAASPEDPQPLTEQEVEEREELLKSGFSNWNRRDFSAFVRACEKVLHHSLMRQPVHMSEGLHPFALLENEATAQHVQRGQRGGWHDADLASEPSDIHVLLLGPVDILMQER